MLTDSDKPAAACAGYLTCLFKDRAGLDPLLAYWRTNQDDHETRAASSTAPSPPWATTASRPCWKTSTDR